MIACFFSLFLHIEKYSFQFMFISFCALPGKTIALPFEKTIDALIVLIEINVRINVMRTLFAVRVAKAIVISR